MGRQVCLTMPQKILVTLITSVCPATKFGGNLSVRQWVKNIVRL